MLFEPIDESSHLEDIHGTIRQRENKGAEGETGLDVRAEVDG